MEDGIEDGVEGLVHVSEMSWTNKNIHPSKVVNVGDAMEVMILDVDQERRRISLGIKQQESDPFSEYVAANDRGTIVTGTVKAVEAKDAVIELSEGIDAVLKASEISIDRIEDARNELKVGDSVEAKIVAVDRRNRSINLSIKAKDVADEKQAIRDVRDMEVTTDGPTTIGDLIKAQMGKQ